MTDAFKDALDNESKNFMSLHMDIPDENFVNFGKTIGAYIIILRVFYNVEIHMEFPVILKVEDKESGLTKYLKLRAYPDFVDIKLNGELPKLTKKEINLLQDNIYDLELWSKYIPSHLFEFHGFVVHDAVDITDQQVLSNLKYLFLEQPSNEIANDKMREYELIRIEKIEKEIRNLLKKPDIEVGLICLPEVHDALNYAITIGKSFLMGQEIKIEPEVLANSIYAHVMEKKKHIIINDLDHSDISCPVVNEMRDNKIKNLLIVPIIDNNKVLGFFEIGSKNPREINDINLLKLKEIFPLLTLSLKQGFENFNSEVQKIVKEKCTAIHPTVEWKFMKEAANYLVDLNIQKDVEMKEIVFENVYPLFAVSDIRNSSTTRNKAIQDDLIEQLYLAQDIIITAYGKKPLSYLNELSFRVGKYIKNLTADLKSGDEIETLGFLRNEVETIFDHIRSFDKYIDFKIIQYLNMIDNDFQINYNRRQKFEKSVERINTEITNILMKDQVKAQEIFPHYFEKYKTDGIEHGLYIGASMVEDRDEFNEIYLKNLRLWQLMTMTKIIRQTDEIKNELEIPLETAHLVLVQDMPLSIRFRMDEKRFDVDGAYNIRYEMLKKRIDKAKIRNTDERLTQPGKLAIVYTQVKEREEYEKYIEYLVNIGYVEKDLEILEIEDLQGVNGLKAMRFTINPKLDIYENSVDNLMISVS